MVRSSALRSFRACYVSVITLAALVNGQLKPLSPGHYHMRSLNDCCNSPGCDAKLENATFTKSAVIVTASQFRRRQGAYDGGCHVNIDATEPDNLIVSTVVVNLRQGLMNGSCIDSYKIETRFEDVRTLPSQCARITPEQLKHFATSNSVKIFLFAKTPLSHFFEGSTLAVVVTSTTDPVDGACGPKQFLCSSTTRCINEIYKCDHINNCGDGSDEEKLGASACFMRKTSLLLISFGVTNFIVTWLSVIYCCIQSAMSKKKALREDRWGMATPPLLSGATGDGNTPPDVSNFGNGSPEDGDTMGALQTAEVVRDGARAYNAGASSNAGERDVNDETITGN